MTAEAAEVAIITIATAIAAETAAVLAATLL